MADLSHSGYATVWPATDPGREDMANIIAHRLLLTAAILAAILGIWSSVSSPQSAGITTDITTSIPELIVNETTPKTVSTLHMNTGDSP